MLTGSILKVRISSSCCGMSVWFYVAWASKVQEVEGSTTISPQFHNNALWRPSYGQTFLQLQHTMHQSTWQWQNIFGYLVTEKNKTKKFSLFVIFGDPKSTKNSENLPDLFIASSTVTGPTCDMSQTFIAGSGWNDQHHIVVGIEWPHHCANTTSHLPECLGTQPRLENLLGKTWRTVRTWWWLQAIPKKGELGWNKYLEIVWNSHFDFGHVQNKLIVFCFYIFWSAILPQLETTWYHHLQYQRSFSDSIQAKNPCFQSHWNS